MFLLFHRKIFATAWTLLGGFDSRSEAEVFADDHQEGRGDTYKIIEVPEGEG